MKLLNKWVEVQGYKHDGGMHRIWDSVFVIDETEEYVVVASKRVKVVEHDYRIWYTKEPAVMVFFRNKWWNIIAMFKAWGVAYYVNLASPYVVDNYKIKYIDYDLDVKQIKNKKIKLIDTNEYDYHKSKYGYSDDIDKILKFNVKEIEKFMIENKFPFIDSKMKEYYDQFYELIYGNKNK